MTLPDLAAAAVRGWVRLYTCGLPPDDRAARIAEVTSDLWESTRERRGRGLADAARVLGRGLMGVWDDCAWRCEHWPARTWPAVAGLVIAITATSLLVSRSSIPSLPLASGGPIVAGWAPVVTPTLPAVVGAPRPVSVSTRKRPANRAPQLSGAWVMDLTRSASADLPAWDPRRTAPPDTALVIAHDGPHLALRFVGGTTTLGSGTFDLRGTVDATADGSTTVLRRASWAGDRIVTVTTRLEKGGAWSIIDVIGLTPDHTSLIVERVTQAGQLWSTYVHREPDRARRRTRDVFVRADPPLGQ